MIILLCQELILLKYQFNSLRLYSEDCLKEIRLFSKEIKLRTGFEPIIESSAENADIVFSYSKAIENQDTFIIEKKDNTLYFSAQNIRGIIYAYSLFLRKTTYKNNEITLISDICGTHTPEQKIRGHQVGYRTTPNTYDAWDYEQYFRCFLDLMAFGSNVAEHTGSATEKAEYNCLMKYTQEEFLKESTRLQDEINLDVSLWQGNSSKESDETALDFRDKLFKEITRLDYLFIPGGDPGDMKADAFVERCKKIYKVLKKHHPNAKLHPSAQAPHCHKDWGDVFIEKLKEEPDEFEMIIMGPNHAFPIAELREKVPEKYPLRFYPDITHNLRCEYPVNFTKDNWHFSFANTLSRESVNPRPNELKTLHSMFSHYTSGSVSYSEGVHDDVNKAVWSALEWNKNTSLEEILEDYGRLFMYGADEKLIKELIFTLEKSWQGDALYSENVDLAYALAVKLKSDYPFLNENWRFILLYFRACCDKIVKMRREFEEGLIKKAKIELEKHNISSALNILKEPFSEEYNTLRTELDVIGEFLFTAIGIQLDTEHYHTDNWERGATLDTIDNNVTDRAFLINKLKKALNLPDNEKKNYISVLLNRNKVESDEVYFSVALHSLEALNTPQNGEFYMDVRGDRPETKENPLPMSMTKVYDHFNLDVKLSDLSSESDYILTVTYKDDFNSEITEHKITANGNIVYFGPQYGGKENISLDEIILSSGFRTASYIIPKEFILNGKLDLCFAEPIDGVKICELWVKKAYLV